MHRRLIFVPTLEPTLVAAALQRRPPRPTTEAPAVTGCMSGVEVGTERLTLDTTDGLTREYRRHVPEGYDGARPRRLCSISTVSRAERAGRW